MERGYWDRLIDRFSSDDACIGVIGLGYVGLPVAVELAKTGFTVLGVDSSDDRVRPILSGTSELIDVSSEDLMAMTKAGRLRASTSYDGLADCDAVLICVPTPLKNGDPDLSAIVAAGTELGKVLGPGTLVVLESTTYPGTTEEVLQPLLEAGGRECGVDFLLAFSPERIDPGNQQFGFADIPKVVGGVTLEATEAAVTLYARVVPKVIPVTSPSRS